MPDDDPASPPHPLFKPPASEWKQRRKIIQLSLSFCALGIAAIIIWPGDASTAVARSNIATQLIWGAGAIIATYVFGAAWDDKNTKESFRR